jgi:glycosyltransferase involved in cell wall biosynthesis
MISIVMPMRNASPYIETCLNSIINQTYTNWELIIVNDHSTDQSEKIIHSLVHNETRIKLLNNKGKGIIDALKLAYANSKGNYITRMDADDIMPIRKLEVLKKIVLKNPNAVSTGKIKYIGKHLREGYIKYEAWMNLMMENHTHYQQIYRECVLPSPAWMMHRQQFEKIGAFNSNVYPEDYDLTLRIYRAKLPIVAANEIIHIWRDYNERTSRNDPNYAFNTFEALKTKYFIEIDYQPSKILVLWGGGKKGKNIARLLKQHDIKFIWACNNPKKINQSIYGLNMENIRTIFNSYELYQTIIAVANPDDQNQIKKELLNLPNVEPFWFC